MHETFSIPVRSNVGTAISGGLGVHVAARVMGEAKPGEVLVSGTVADLVIGSGISFRERASAQLKGAPPRRMLEVTSRGG